MYVMIDNYDSFVYNLAAYFRELGQEIRVIRRDRIIPEELEVSASEGQLEGIVISPGPGCPAEVERPQEIVRNWAGRVPVLGVCLGHQIIGQVFGADVVRGRQPVHGKVTAIRNNGKGLFRGLPDAYRVTRYHSLVIDRDSVPPAFRIDAVSEDGAVMAVSCVPEETEAPENRGKNGNNAGWSGRRPVCGPCPVYGVQFHPEAVLTEYGHELLNNFIQICGSWRQRQGGGLWRSNIRS